MYCSNMLPPGVATVAPSTAREVVDLKQQNSDKVLAEYIWVGATGADLKSRSVVLDEYQPGCSPDLLPIAEIDGGELSEGELYLQPRKIFPDPFRGGQHILVLCDIYVPPLVCNAADPWDNMQPHTSNHRAACDQVMKHAGHQQPVFTMQQEYTLCCNTCYGQLDGGFYMGSVPMPIKNAAGFAPSVISDKATARLGRDVSELHMHACVAAGLSFSGSSTTSTHQHSYKIGPCLGVDMADQLCLSRYLLQRIAQHSAADIHYDTLGKSGSSTGNKCSIQFSTASSRDPISGLSSITVMMERLNSSHLHASAAPYAAGSRSGQSTSCSWHSSSGFSETGLSEQQQNMTRFSTGAGRHSSIMVPTSTILNGCGPILDRRPPASADPYLTSMLLVSSACGVPLRQATLSAMQLAVTLQGHAAAHAAAVFDRSASVAVPSSQRHTHSCRSFGSPSSSDACSSAAPSCSFDSLSGLSGGNTLGGGRYSRSGCSSGYSGLSGSLEEDSQDVLLSALDRLDGRRCSSRTTSPVVMSCAGSVCSYLDDDIRSDASSPITLANALAEAVNEDDMYF